MDVNWRLRDPLIRALDALNTGEGILNSLDFNTL
jgi:hypothetical protein